jgi:hypothetical protein
MLFINCCEICPLKKGKTKKSVVVKPILSKEQNERCQVILIKFTFSQILFQLDLIDLQSKPDREFKFVLVYQDHLTKFALIRPLRSKTAIEVATQVKSIFGILGELYLQLNFDIVLYRRTKDPANGQWS